mmetsp:Transcript_14512/g.41357  ORF Transcript_14512/g.41357 Transcript_14512/m.41357 type:complete len:181 (-) Transcript_14512:60-602(-)
MDIVLGLSEEKWEEEEEEGEGTGEGPKGHGTGEGAGASDKGGEGIDGHLNKIRKVSHALEAAEILAKKRASVAKVEGLERSEKGSSLQGLASSREGQKNYVVNVEDLNIPTTTKENTIPTFKSTRGLRGAADGAPEESPAKAGKLVKKPAPASNAGKSAKHSKFMARYGLQKYSNLFKPI